MAFATGSSDALAQSSSRDSYIWQPPALPLSVARAPGNLQGYYQRKIAEGKAKMLVINAVRNKLITRICACVRENRQYEKIYERKIA